MTHLPSEQKLDKKYQIHILVLGLSGALLEFLFRLSSGAEDLGSAVRIGGAVGSIIGRSLIPMIVGLVVYGSAKKKMKVPSGTGLRAARKKAFIAIVIVYGLLLFSSLAN